MQIWKRAARLSPIVRIELRLMHKDMLMKTWFILAVSLLLGGLLSGCQNTPAALSEVRSTYSLTAAQAAYAKADFISAEALLQQHVQQHPQDPDAWFLLGNLYLRTAQHSAAQRAYTRATQLKPQQAEIWHNLALVHLRQATQILLEGQLHHDDAYQPLLGWLLYMQGVDANGGDEAR